MTASDYGVARPSLAQRALLALIRIPPLYRGSLRPFWVKVLSRLRAGPVDVTTAYGDFRVFPETNLVDSALLIHPCYNKAEIDFLLAQMPPDGTFVDIGANIGLYSVAIGRHLRRGGRVVSIEPNPVCLERLSYNLRINGLDHARVFGVGVGDFEGKGRLIVERNDLAIAHTVRDDAHGDFAVRPLSRILDEAGVERIDGLKIDVEGFEMAALGPFFESAPKARWPRRICIEHLGDKSDVMELLKDCGYRLARNTRNNSLLILAP